MAERRVLVIGVAPGQTSLSEDLLRQLEAADLLVSAERHIPLAKGFKGETLPVEGKVSEAVARVVSDKALKAVFLASGDPGFFGIGALLYKKLPGEVELIPAVTSLQAAFAKLGASWSEARFASLHGKGFENLFPLLGAPAVGLLTDEKNSPSSIASFLVEAGWGDLKMGVCGNLGLAGETVELGPVASFTRWTGPALNVVALFNEKPDERPLGPGIPDEEFIHPRGRITKSFVRAAALAKLSLPRRGVMWDVGAGSGSVGIEAALLSPNLRVYGVEKDDEAFSHAVENRKKFRAASLSLHHGEAPEALAALPDPDRVFIGGSGGQLPEVLDHAFARLSAGGTIVVSTVLAETFHTSLGWARARNLQADWSELLASHSKPTGSGTRLSAQDPVTLLRIVKG